MIVTYFLWFSALYLVRALSESHQAVPDSLDRMSLSLISAEFVGPDVSVFDECRVRWTGCLCL